MAAKPSERLLSEVTCSECQKYFKEPVTLACLHTYCRDCLVELIKDDGEAASNKTSAHNHEQENLKTNACDPFLCVELKKLKLDSMNKMPTNHCFENIIKHINREDDIRSENKKCEVCLDELPAVYYCRECEDALCETCRVTHTKSKKTVNHHLQTMDEIRSLSKKESFSGVGMRVTWKCQKHPQQDVRFYCFDCNELICSDCAVTKHNTCNKEMSDKVFEAKPELKTDLEEQIKKVEHVYREFEKAVKSIDTTKKTLQESKDKARQAIEERHQKMVEELQRQKEELLHRANEIFEQKDKNLEKQHNKLQRIMNALRNPLDLSQDILDVGIPEEILYFRAMMQDRLNQLFADYDTYNRDARDNDIITFKDTKLDLTTAIGTVTGDPHISEFTLEDPLPRDLHFIMDQPTSFKVRSRDIVGAALCETRHEELVVELQPVGEEGEAIKGMVEKEKEVVKKGEIERERETGLYKVTITAPQAGKYNLKIFVNIRDTQVHIKDSPFEEINVIPPVTLNHQREIKSEYLASPWGIAVSSDKKKIVLTDVSHHCLIMFDENCEFQRTVGKEGDGELEFRSPRGVVFTPDDRQIVVVEKENNRVQILSADGEFVSKFGRRGAEEGQFCNPTNVAVSNEGLIFVSDRTNQRIQFFKLDGTCVGMIGVYGQTLGAFNDPYAIAVDDQDQVFVTEYSGSRIQVLCKANDVEASGYKSVRQFSNSDMRQPVGIVYDAQNRFVFVSEKENQRVSVFSRTGHYFTSFGTEGSGPNQFMNAMGLGVLGNNQLIVADCGNHRLLVFRY